MVTASAYPDVIEPSTTEKPAESFNPATEPEQALAKNNTLTDYKEARRYTKLIIGGD